MVSGSSPTATASVDSPTGRPRSRSARALRWPRHDLVQALGVGLEHVEGDPGLHLQADPSGCPHLGEVANPAEQPVGDAGRPPGAAGDLLTCVVLDCDAEDGGGAPDDRRQLVRLVEVEAAGEAEAVPERRREHAGTGGGTDQREAGDVDRIDRADGPLPMTRSRRKLHRQVKDLLHGAGEAVDLVDEEHVAVLEVGEDGREVPGPLQHRAGRHAETDPQLGGDDLGKSSSCRAPDCRRRAGGRLPRQTFDNGDLDVARAKGPGPHHCGPAVRARWRLCSRIASDVQPGMSDLVTSLGKFPDILLPPPRPCERKIQR